MEFQRDKKERKEKEKRKKDGKKKKKGRKMERKGKERMVALRPHTPTHMRKVKGEKY
jgi:hypothetical protein